MLQLWVLVVCILLIATQATCSATQSNSGLLVGQIFQDPNDEDLKFIPPITNPYNTWEELKQVQRKDPFGFDVKKYYLLNHEMRDKNVFSSAFQQRKNERMKELSHAKAEKTLNQFEFERLNEEILQEIPFVHKKIQQLSDRQSFTLEKAVEMNQKVLDVDMKLARGIVNFDFLRTVLEVNQKSENLLEIKFSSLSECKAWVPGTRFIIKTKSIKGIDLTIDQNDYTTAGKPEYQFYIVMRRISHVQSGKEHTVQFYLEGQGLKDLVLEGGMKMFIPSTNQPRIGSEVNAIDLSQPDHTYSIYALGINFDTQEKTVVEPTITLFEQAPWTAKCIDCYAMLELNVFYSIHFGWTGINEFSVAIGGQFWMNYLVDLNFDLNIQKKWTKQFGLIPKQKISFSVGIVPVWFDFWANMGIEAYAELTAQFQASMRNNYKKSIWIGTSYTSGSGWDKFYKTGTDGLLFQPPQFDAGSASLTLGITFLPEFIVYAYSTIGFKTKLIPNFEVNMNTKYPYTIDSGFKCGANSIEYSSKWNLNLDFTALPIKLPKMLSIFGASEITLGALPISWEVPVVTNKPLLCSRCAGCWKYMTRAEANAFATNTGNSTLPDIKVDNMYILNPIQNYASITVEPASAILQTSSECTSTYYYLYLIHDDSYNGQQNYQTSSNQGCYHSYTSVWQIPKYSLKNSSLRFRLYADSFYEEFSIDVSQIAEFNQITLPTTAVSKTIQKQVKYTSSLSATISFKITMSAKPFNTLKPGLLPMASGTDKFRDFYSLDHQNCMFFYYASMLQKYLKNTRLDVEMQNYYETSTFPKANAYYIQDTPDRLYPTSGTMAKTGIDRYFGMQIKDFSSVSFGVCSDGQSNPFDNAWFRFSKFNEIAYLSPNTNITTPEIPICTKCALFFFEESNYGKIRVSFAATPKAIIGIEQTGGTNAGIYVFGRADCGGVVQCSNAKVEFFPDVKNNYMESEIATYTMFAAGQFSNMMDNLVKFNTTIYSRNENSFKLTFIPFYEGLLGTPIPISRRVATDNVKVLFRFVIPPEMDFSEIENLAFSGNNIKTIVIAVNSMKIDNQTTPKLTESPTSTMNIKLAIPKLKELARNDDVDFIAVQLYLGGSNLNSDFSVDVERFLFAGKQTKLHLLQKNNPFTLQDNSFQTDIESFNFIVQIFDDALGKKKCASACGNLQFEVLDCEKCTTTKSFLLNVINSTGNLSIPKSTTGTIRKISLVAPNSIYTAIYAKMEYQSISISTSALITSNYETLDNKNTFFFKIPKERLSQSIFFTKSDSAAVFIPRFGSDGTLDGTSKKLYPTKQFIVNCKKEFPDTAATFGLVATTGRFQEVSAPPLPKISWKIVCPPSGCILREGDYFMLSLQANGFQSFDYELFYSKKAILLDFLDKIVVKKNATIDSNPSIIAKAITLARSKVVAFIQQVKTDDLMEFFELNFGNYSDISIKIPLPREAFVATNLIKQSLKTTEIQVTSSNPCYSTESANFEGKFNQTALLSETEYSMDGTATSICIASNYYFTCFGMNSTDPKVCSGHGTCKSNENCGCNPGWEGNSCQTVTTCFGIPSTNPKSCSGHGSCMEAGICACDTGFTFENCQSPLCSGVAANQTSVCSGRGICASPNNCSCISGYGGSNCEQFTCFGTVPTDSKVCSGKGTCESQNYCKCRVEYYGADCSVASCFGIMSNLSSVCSGKGKCFDRDTCNCDSGYGYAKDCSLTACFGITANETTKVCSGNGKCVGPDVCNCGTNGLYTGNNCQYPICFGLASSDPLACSGKGNCVQPNLCSCQKGYTHERCHNPICFGFAANETACSGNGKCVGPDVCNCDANGFYTGNNCQYPACFGLAPSDPLVCSGKGNCTQPNLCSCQKGYTHERCHNPICFGFAANETAKTCSGNGKCIAPDSCECGKGHTDKECDKKSGSVSWKRSNLLFLALLFFAMIW